MYNGLNKSISASLIGGGDVNKNAHWSNKTNSKNTYKLGAWLFGVQN